jgi:hypothetical protein
VFSLACEAYHEDCKHWQQGNAREDLDWDGGMWEPPACSVEKVSVAQSHQTLGVLQVLVDGSTWDHTYKC